MSQIPTSPISANLFSLNAQRQQSEAIKANFDALLFNADVNSGGNGFIDSFFENISSSINGDYSTKPQAIDPNTFPFSASFTSTFGTSGPLPAFITMMSSAMKLNAAQNQAFQDIAVRNKDITKTPENIQKIALELQQAGIGYSLIKS